MDVGQFPLIYAIFGLMLVWWAWYKIRCLRNDAKSNSTIKQAVKDGVKEAITELKKEGVL
jgi:hypothetical protein